MKCRLFFNNGKSIDLACEPADFMGITLRTGPGASHREGGGFSAPQISSWTLVTECHYGGEEIITQNPRKKFCNKSHRNLYSLYGLTKTTAK